MQLQNFTRLSILYEGMVSSETAPQSGGTTDISQFESEVCTYGKLMTARMLAGIASVIEPLRTFRYLNGKYILHYSAFVLDAEYITLKGRFMKLHTRNKPPGRALAKKYDKEFVLRLLVNIFNSRQVAITTAVSTDITEESSIPVTGMETNESPSDDDCLDIGSAQMDNVRIRTPI